MDRTGQQVGVAQGFSPRQKNIKVGFKGNIILVAMYGETGQFNNDDIIN